LALRTTRDAHRNLYLGLAEKALQHPCSIKEVGSDLTAECPWTDNRLVFSRLVNLIHMGRFRIKSKPLAILFNLPNQIAGLIIGFPANLFNKTEPVG
jgi:hypothetical protein